MKIKIRRRCKCGCGKITNYGRKWIGGHNVKGRKDSLKTRKKKSISKMGNVYGKWRRSKETKLKMSISQIGNVNGKGNKGVKKSDETKLKMSLIQLEHWQDSEYQKKQYEARDIRPNKPEIKLKGILNNLFPNEYKYVGDFQFWLGGKNPDFMNINGQKKLIEFFGDYWHEKESEQIRINHFKQYGFDTLVIWEHELKNKLKLRRKLMGFHRG